MIYCRNCGRYSPGDTNFCAYCGFELSPEDKQKAREDKEKTLIEEKQKQNQKYFFAFLVVIAFIAFFAMLFAIGESDDDTEWRMVYWFSGGSDWRDQRSQTFDLEKGNIKIVYNVNAADIPGDDFCVWQFDIHREGDSIHPVVTHSAYTDTSREVRHFLTSGKYYCEVFADGCSWSFFIYEQIYD